MTGHDPLAAWRGNPFFVLEVSTDAPRAEVERAGQKLLALLALGSTSAGHCDTPLGPATRDADGVRQAVAALRDPVERVVHELWADLAPRIAPTVASTVVRGVGGQQSAPAGGAWPAAERALGWTAKWAE
jgi:hypothetical protein